MPYNLDEYNYLWDDSAPGWVLLKAPDLVSGYCIFNEVHSSVLLVEDEKLNLALCQQMKARGRKEIDALPKIGPVKVVPRS